jgi:serine/threonine protein kinase
LRSAQQSATWLDDPSVSTVQSSFYEEPATPAITQDSITDVLERSEKMNQLKASRLRKMPAMARAPKDVINYLADSMSYDTLQPGDRFCTEGDYGDEMFILVFGRADVHVNGKGVVSVMKDGDFMGEAAAMLGCLRVATCIAQTRCDYFTIERTSLMEAIVMYPALKEEMDKNISRRRIERDYSLEERLRSDIQQLINRRCKEDVERRIIKHREVTAVRWKKNKVIGRGAFGVVYSALNTGTGEQLAVKTLQTGQMTAAMKIQLQRESELMTQLLHDNIVQGYGMERDEEKQEVHIIMELLPGSLQKILDEYGALAESVARNYATQLLTGLQYLHGERVLHRDIKPANALVNTAGVIKLSDFGISQSGLQQDTATVSGTPPYLSPDAISGQYSIASDIWAMGCTILELVTGVAPWTHLGMENTTQLIFKIGMYPDGYPLPDGLSAPLHELLSIMLHKDPKSRLDAGALLSCTWFTVPEDELPTTSHFASEASGTFQSLQTEHDGNDEQYDTNSSFGAR